MGEKSTWFRTKGWLRETGINRDNVGKTSHRVKPYIGWVKREVQSSPGKIEI